MTCCSSTASIVSSCELNWDSRLKPTEARIRCRPRVRSCLSLIEMAPLSQYHCISYRLAGPHTEQATTFSPHYRCRAVIAAQPGSLVRVAWPVLSSRELAHVDTDIKDVLARLVQHILFLLRLLTHLSSSRFRPPFPQHPPTCEPPSLSPALCWLAAVSRCPMCVRPGPQTPSHPTRVASRRPTLPVANLAASSLASIPAPAELAAPRRRKVRPRSRPAERLISSAETSGGTALTFPAESPTRLRRAPALSPARPASTSR